LAADAANEVDARLSGSASKGKEWAILFPARTIQQFEKCSLEMTRKEPKMSNDVYIAAGEPLALQALISPTAQGISSRILAKTGGGNMTLFAFDAGQGLTEHTSPFEALVMVLDGTLTLTIGGTPALASPGTIVRMPAGVPHALDAPEPCRMLLTMLK
jgi:quercetin dioxygenase-like cupin family protein